MISNKFKSKARNIAFKSFINEIERRGWYLLLVQGCVSLISHDSESVDRMISNVREGMQRKSYTSVCEIKKDIISKVIEKTSNTIDRNFESNRRGMGSSEYEYLVHCVNTFIQIFVEHGILSTKAAEKDRNFRFEELGEKIFVRAAKKIFGEDFKLEKPKTSQLPPKPLNREEEEFLKSVMIRLVNENHHNMRMEDAFEIAKQELLRFRLNKEAALDTFSDIQDRELVFAPFDDDDDDWVEEWEEEDEDWDIANEILD